MRTYVRKWSALLFLLLLTACGSKALPAPDTVYRILTDGYGALPYGMYYETDAADWQKEYLSPQMTESLFGADDVFRQTVQAGCLYLSGAPDVHEEIAVLLCYSSEGALQMAGILTERAQNLTLTEDAWDAPEALTVCRGRYLIYCRLSDRVRAQRAIDRLDL